MSKILLVEDDPFLVEIYGTKLREAGFVVETAQDGQEAIRKAGEQKPDLVVLDIVLPKIEGWEILRAMKSDSNLKEIKIVILSSLAQKEEIEKSLKMGAVKHIIKSQHTPTQVTEEIQKILSG